MFSHLRQRKYTHFSLKMLAFLLQQRQIESLQPCFQAFRWLENSNVKMWQSCFFSKNFQHSQYVRRLSWNSQPFTLPQAFSCTSLTFWDCYFLVLTWNFLSLVLNRVEWRGNPIFILWSLVYQWNSFFFKNSFILSMFAFL